MNRINHLVSELRTSIESTLLWERKHGEEPFKRTRAGVYCVCFMAEIEIVYEKEITENKIGSVYFLHKCNINFIDFIFCS